MRKSLCSVSITAAVIAGTAISAAAQPLHAASHSAAVVPEPSGIVALATGVTGFIGYCARRRSHR